MARVAAEASASALQYGPTDGFHALKSCIVEVMGEEGMTVSEDELLVTAGGQQVIDLVCKTLIDPGDVIIAEGPTYPGAVPTFRAYEADVVQIELDDDGMRVDLLEQALDPLAREGRTPKFVYTVPTFQDPAGVTMSLERRRRLVRMASERELLVLEDKPYGLLRYEGDPLPTLYALDGGEYVAYLETFSKILAPGLRLGWTAAPRPVLEKLALAKQGADLCPSSFGPYFVIEYFARRDWRDLIGSRRAHYPHRRDAMLEAMAEHFPREAQWTSPAGGLFIWATLPDYIDTTDLLALALREHVAFVPGRAAYLDGRGSAAMRLSFSAADEEDLRDGIRSDRQGGERPGATVPHADQDRPRDGARTLRARIRRRSVRARPDPAVASSRRMSRVAVLAGGQSLERQVSLRSAGRVRDALEQLGHEGIAIDVGRTWSIVSPIGGRTSPSSLSTGAMAKTEACRRFSS